MGGIVSKLNPFSGKGKKPLNSSPGINVIIIITIIIIIIIIIINIIIIIIIVIIIN